MNKVNRRFTSIKQFGTDSIEFTLYVQPYYVSYEIFIIK